MRTGRGKLWIIRLQRSDEHASAVKKHPKPIRLSGVSACMEACFGRL